MTHATSSIDTCPEPRRNRQSAIGNLFRTPVRVAFLWTLVALTGCSQYIDPNVPEPIRPFTEPQYGGEYLLYRPSSYNREHAWPLVVVCHSCFPDTPNRRIRAWTELAESHGFLLVAPQLTGAKKSWSRNANEKHKRQVDDEARILAVIQHVRAACNVSDDRILIHGFAAGAASALRTGLKHSQTFRAIGLTQPNFDAAELADVASWIDPYQSVNLSYAAADLLTGKEGRSCADWLRAHGTNLRDDPTGSPAGSDAARYVEFFQQVIRKELWIHVTATPTGLHNPLEMRFKLMSSSPPARFRWQFGDGDESPVAEPTHAYSKAGTYRVAVTVEWQKTNPHTRILDLTVPDAILRPAHSSTP
jgi:dienelactone hydrolase